MERVPGMPDPRVLLGAGKLLGGPILPRTQHTTIFNACSASLTPIYDGEGICQGYRFLIIDSTENHLYIYNFDQEGLDALQGQASIFPKVGEKMPDEGPTPDNVVPLQ